MKSVLSILIVSVVSLAACSGSSTGGIRPLGAEDLMHRGGCWRVVYAANSDWSEVVQVTLTAPWELMVNEPTDLEVHTGVTARLTSGENLANLYCNDYLEGNEVAEFEASAEAGSVTVTIAEPFPRDGGGDGSHNIPVVVRINDLEFADGDGFVTVGNLTIETTIGWLAG